MVGVFLTFRRQNSLRNRCQSDGGRYWGGPGCCDGALTINAGVLLEQWHHQIERTLPPRGDFRARQRSAGEADRRPLSNRPTVAAGGFGVLLQADGCGIGGPFL